MEAQFSTLFTSPELLRYAQIAEGDGRIKPERSIAWPMHLTVDVKFTVVEKAAIRESLVQIRPLGSLTSLRETFRFSGTLI